MKIFDVYSLLNLEPVKAKGNYVYCKNGNKYLDFYGGHAVISIGHSHPHYVDKISHQLQKIGFYSNSVQNPLQKELATKLGTLSGYDGYQLFLSNSGAEAIENALKMASFYNGRSKVVSFNKAFHGRTSAALSITDNEKYSTPLNNGTEVIFLELNNAMDLEKELSKGDVCAVVLEGIQGISGIHIPDKTFLKDIEKLCEKYDTVFICDEIQSGYGRTGKFFAHQHAGITPDIITVAKGMGNGFPIAGTILNPKFKAVYGRLGSTYGGNHLACTAAISVLEIIEREQLISWAARCGNQLIQKLSNVPQVNEVRGRGLMIGMEFPFPIKNIRKKLIDEEQIITGVSSNPNVLRLLPPLTIRQQEIDQFINAINNVLTQQKVL